MYTKTFQEIKAREKNQGMHTNRGVPRLTIVYVGLYRTIAVKLGMCPQVNKIRDPCKKLIRRTADKM